MRNLLPDVSPIARLRIACVTLAGATAGAYFLGSSPLGMFLLGLSLMLLLPMTLVSAIDLAREMRNGVRTAPNYVRNALFIPIGLLAACSLSIGAYLLADVLFHSTRNSWGSLLAGLMTGAIFLAFGIKLLRSTWSRSRDQHRPSMTPEEAAAWYREKTIADARALPLPDGVYNIVFYNSQYRQPETLIDPFQVFSSEPSAVVQEWIGRAKNMLAANYPVGDALVGKKESYERMKDEYIASNPGFSARTYAHAIHVGAGKAVQ